MKIIDTLVEDIYSVVDGNGGWDETVTEFFAGGLSKIVQTRLSREETSRPTLRMSNLGTPCARKLWYSVNKPDESIPLPPDTKLKFLYGDILEELLLSLAVAAGHDVQGCQDTLKIGDIVGHRDAVIDGITVDVKSASSFAFKKFQEGNLRNDDPFGYISQLSSYVYAGRDSEVPSHPTVGAFLVIDKQHGDLCLDKYDLTEEIEGKEKEVQRLVDVVAHPVEPQRAFTPVPEGKSGNKKLGTVCSYCSFKKVCYPEVRGFAYSNGPMYLTTVVKEPKPPEFEV